MPTNNVSKQETQNVTIRADFSVWGIKDAKIQTLSTDQICASMDEKF
jgi:hypothetical protein